MNKMGFGFLRLPEIGEGIDCAQLNRITGAFLAAGGATHGAASRSRINCRAGK